MQLNKNIKIFINYLLGPLLFAWLVFSIYRQVMHQDQLEASWTQIRQSFSSRKILYLLLAMALIPLNWGLEAVKWKLSVQTTYPIRFGQAFKAVLSGVSFSVTMPNRVGEYLGRMMYLPEGNRLKTISVTLIGSFAQLLVTIIMGTLGILVLWPVLLKIYPELGIWYQFIAYGLVGVSVLLLVVYYNIASAVGLFRRWMKAGKHDYLVEGVKQFHGRLLNQLLLLSLSRYIVFVIQYVLVFYLFEVNVPALTILGVMSIVFLAMAIVPSIALVEVGIRGEISIKLMGLFSANVLGIGFTSITVWFINLILPAILGSLLLLNLRVFKRKHESG